MESLLEIESPIAEVIVDDKATLEVQSGAELTVESLPAVSLEIFQSSYAVVVDDIYIKTSVGEIPLWLQNRLELISNNLINPTALSLDELWTAHNLLSDGYNFTIANFNDSITAQNTSIENLTTRVDGDLASFQTLIDTKITNTQSQAQIDQSLIAFKANELTEASAWWQNIISTVANDLVAKGNQIATLTASNNNNSASITTVNQVLATHDSAIAKSSQYVTAQVGGETLITGFALTSSIDPAGDQISSIVFNANDFRIYTTDITQNDTATPVFQVNGSNVSFNGVVDFNSLVDGLGQTIINGGQIKSEHLIIDRLDAGTITLDQTMRDQAFDASPDYTTGFQIKADAAGTFADPNIYGAYLRGSYIYGATMESSEMFVRDLRVLTDDGEETDVFLYGSVVAIEGNPYANPAIHEWRFGVYASDSTDVGVFKLAKPGVNEAVFNHGSGGIKIGNSILYSKNQTLVCQLLLGETVVETVNVALVTTSTNSDIYARFNHGFDLFFSYYTAGSSSPTLETQIYIIQEDSNSVYYGVPGGNYMELRNFSGNGELKLRITGNQYDGSGSVSGFPIFVSNI